MRKYNRISILPLTFDQYSKNLNKEYLNKTLQNSCAGLNFPYAIYFSDCVKFMEYRNTEAEYHKKILAKVFYPFANFKQWRNVISKCVNQNTKQEFKNYVLDRLHKIYHSFPVEKFTTLVNNI